MIILTYLITKMHSFFFFFKDLFFIIFFFYWKGGYTERRYREEDLPQVSTTADAMPIQSQEPLLGLPHGCRVPKLWTLDRPRLPFRAIGRELEGKRGCRDRLDAHMGSPGVQGEDLNHLRHRAGPPVLVSDQLSSGCCGHLGN